MVHAGGSSASEPFPWTASGLQDPPSLTADAFAELPSPPAVESLCIAVGRLAAAAVARGDFAKAQELIARAADLAQVDAEVA